MATVFTVHHDVNFTTKPTKNYFLSVVVGNGQSGSTTFKNPAGTLFSPDVLNVPLGLGQPLKGTTLPLVSVVMDINPQTDNMIVSCFILTQEVTEDQLQTLTPTDSVPFAAQTSQTITFFINLNFH
jgi:hypothetical protein